MKAKVIKLKVKMVGLPVPSNFGGEAGRDIENKLRKQGIPISNGPGADVPLVNLEVKSRDLDATSAQSVGSMTPEAIIATSYKQSVIFEKLQQQYRVKTKNKVIVSAEIYDFSSSTIQEKIERCYELARQKIIAGDQHDYVAGGKYGFFERTVGGSRSYEFRFANGAMKQLESMSKSTFHKLFIIE
jgi:hypothetical protein